MRDSPDIIVLLDVDDGTMRGAQPRRLLRPSARGLGRSRAACTRIVDADDRAEADAHWARMRELEPEQVCEATLRLRDADGEIRHARLRFSPLDAGDAERVRGTRLLGAISDVTDQSNNELREAELQEALRRSQRLEAVGQLAGGVAHDFNNLLAAILASAELLTDDVPEGRPREYADEIQRSAVRGAALVRQLLTFAQRDRAEPARRRPQRDRRRHGAAAAAQPRRARAAPDHDDRLLDRDRRRSDASRTGDPQPRRQRARRDARRRRAVDRDRDRLRRRRARERPRRAVGDRHRHRHRARGARPDVRAVRDHEGAGQGHRASGSRPCSRSCTGMDGQIEVLTKVGEGTTFEISFARRFGELDPAGARGPDDEIDGAGTRGSCSSRTTTPCAARSPTGCNGSASTSRPRPAASEALQIVEQRTFDLVLTDAVMPGISGPELIEHLRESRPELRIILMSGYTPGESGDDDDPTGYSDSASRSRRPSWRARCRRAFERGPVEQSTDMSRPRVLIVDDDEQICFVATRALEAIAYL